MGPCLISNPSAAGPLRAFPPPSGRRERRNRITRHRRPAWRSTWNRRSTSLLSPSPKGKEPAEGGPGRHTLEKGRTPAGFRCDRGTAALEFLLAAPVLLLILLCVLQLLFLGIGALSAQRAAYAGARQASLEGDALTGGFQVSAALLPLGLLHPSASAAVLGARVHVQPEDRDLLFQVGVPFPLWVPLAGRILGESARGGIAPFRLLEAEARVFREGSLEEGAP